MNPIEEKPSEQPEHTHIYEVAVNASVIVRWCRTCGKVWTIVRSPAGVFFTETWNEVKDEV